MYIILMEAYKNLLLFRGQRNKNLKNMKFSYLLIVLSFIGCNSNELKIKKKSYNKEGLRIDENQIDGKSKFAIAYDSFGLMRTVRSIINDSIYEELSFEDDGSLYSKLRYNFEGQLVSNGYFFYPSGCLKSMRMYSNGKYYNRGIDYFDLSGIVLRNIFYDSTGLYYYRTDFSDTSTYYEHYFNHENPLSYLMIKRKAPEYIRTKLLKLMEEIGLDSLKQIQ